MARPPLPAVAGLGAKLGVDHRRVYGGRVIAESEEEYATRRQPALLSQGYVEPYGAAGGMVGGVPSTVVPAGPVGNAPGHGMDWGPQYSSSRYRVVPGNAGPAGVCVSPRGEVQMLESPAMKLQQQQHGFEGPQDMAAALMVYPGAELERSKSGGLLRSIREGTMLMHTAGTGQVPQQASILQQQKQQHQQQENRYMQPNGPPNAMDYRLHPYNSYSGRHVYPGHSLPIRDHRTIYNHISSVGDNMGSRHETIRREPRKRKVDGIDRAFGGSQRYAPVQDVPRVGHEDLMPLHRRQVQNLRGSGNLQPLSFPSSQNAALLQESRMHSFLPPGTVQMAQCGAQSLSQTVCPMFLLPERNSCKQGEGAGSFTALLHDVHEPAKVESINCQKSAQNVLPQEPMLDLKGNSNFKDHVLSRSHDHPGVSKADMLQLAKIPGMGQSHNMLGLQPFAYPPSLPQSMRTGIGRHPTIAGQANQGLPHAQQLDVRQMDNKPAQLQTISPSGIIQHEKPIGNRKSIWPSGTSFGMDKTKEKLWSAAAEISEEQSVLPVKSPLEGILQQQEASHGLLNSENEIGENDAMLRPFGDTVGTEDLFDEGFELDGGSFAHINPSHSKDHIHATEDNQALKSSAYNVTGNPSDQFETTEVCQLEGVAQVEAWKESMDEIGHVNGSSGQIHKDDVLVSGEDGGSPASLDFLDISAVQGPSIDTNLMWDDEKLCSNEPGCINLDPTHNKDNCSNEGFNCALFEEGETTEDEELNLDSTKGSVGLKCPRVFHNLSSNDKAQSSLSDKVLKSTGRGAASLAHKRSLSKLCIPPVERKLTDQTCDFLAVAGLGFDENEYQNIFKAPPRFPRKMIVKREDVVQLAISMAGKPAVTVEEILDICKWWQLQSEAETGAASRANVLKSWHGLKLAAAFLDGAKGRASLIRCLEQDDRFGLCGFADNGQELWGCQQIERCGDNLEERRSDSDDKTNFWLPEQEEWRLKNEESPRTTGKHDESAFQRAVIDERKRRRLLATLQYELAPKFGLGRERVFDSSEEHPSPLWNFAEDSQSLSRYPKYKRQGSSSVAGVKSDGKDCSTIQSPGKPKTRSLSDVYARGPKVFNGNESSGTIPDQEMDSNPSSERLNSEHNGRIIYVDRDTTSKQGFRSVGNWLDRSNGSYLDGKTLGGALSKAG